jgi:protein involved in polysaccharide export with SLBB domain
MVVRLDGKIVIALVGAVYVLGLTASQAQDLLTERLKLFVSSPRVTVDVLGKPEPVTGPGRPEQEWRLPDIWPIA